MSSIYGPGDYRIVRGGVVVPGLSAWTRKSLEAICPDDAYVAYMPELHVSANVNVFEEYIDEMTKQEYNRDEYGE